MKFFDKYELFIFDLDGVIYTGNKLIKNADLIIKTLQNNNKEVYFLTNNSTKTRKEFQNKLKKLNIQIDLKNIITSAYSTSYYLNKKFRNKKNAYVIGQEGIKTELLNLHFKIFDSYKENLNMDFVIVGLDKFFDYNKLTNALHYLIKGSLFIATNEDPTLPTEYLPLPGAGSIIKAIETCYGKRPTMVIGKPNSFMIDLILENEKINREKIIIIGDRLSTDILTGINAKIDTLLVKTGSGQEELNNKELNYIKPNYIINSIANLLEIK